MDDFKLRHYHFKLRHYLISGEMLASRKPGHRIYFTSSHDWKNHPEWARSRREEIFTRIKSMLKELCYEYWETD
jgi:hypothetical protein